MTNSFLRRTVLHGGRQFELSEHTFEACCYRNSAAPVAQWLRRCATNQKVACSILRTIPARIPNEWLLRPQFYLWPPQRQRAVLWVLSRFVTFRLYRQRGPTLHPLMDFLRRSKWELYQSPSRCRSVANFLTVLDTT